MIKLSHLLRILTILSLFLLFQPEAMAQEKPVSPKKQARLDRKREKKKEKEARKAEKEAFKRHYKIQCKATRKRLKKQRRKANKKNKKKWHDMPDAVLFEETWRLLND